ncbi:hypothetical protein [Dysgonomonas sp. 520]|uniref:hypothetical protein n=1 Tax=Dysgonomonas sp. 520 TaxID=2302931 RepID=UPI0013D07863|nr:hypothetical protein [Dysgonomonas sp. 520]NDW11023.1 hypothetical protein [Dysgonomonas sp. 520]
MRISNHKLKSLLLATVLFFGIGYAHAQVTVGSELTPNEGALLDVKESASNNTITSTKGINLPRVALQDPYKLEPCATTTTSKKTAHKGLTVYHTGAASMDEGMYYWNGTEWRRLVDEIPPTPTNKIRQYYQSANIVGGTTTDNATSLKFCQKGSTAVSPIKLPETGSYAFNVKLYTLLCQPDGTTKTPTYAGTVCVYLYIYVNGVLNDVSEVFYTLGPNATSSTLNRGNNVTNVILGCSGNAGDVVDIRFRYNTGWIPDGDAVLSRGNSSLNPGVSARTSMLFWKI